MLFVMSRQQDMRGDILIQMYSRPEAKISLCRTKKIWNEKSMQVTRPGKISPLEQVSQLLLPWLTWMLSQSHPVQKVRSRPVFVWLWNCGKNGYTKVRLIANKFQLQTGFDFLVPQGQKNSTMRVVAKRFVSLSATPDCMASPELSHQAKKN